MAEMNISEGNGPKAKVRMNRVALRVDLTPMVDLAFLLITFFMLTTSLLKQKAIELNEPDTHHPPAPVSECQVLNLITDSVGRVYCWEGLECHEVSPISMTGDHSLRDKIRARKAFLKSNCLYTSGKPKDLICLIKLLPGSQYESMVRLLDEVAADSVPIYAIQRYSDEELKAVEQEQHKMAMNRIVYQ
jgi:biopolymer transport protein ExbD